MLLVIILILLYILYYSIWWVYLPHIEPVRSMSLPLLILMDLFLQIEMFDAGVFLLQKSRFVSSTITKISDLWETVFVFTTFFPIKFGRRAIFSESNYSLVLNMEQTMKHQKNMSWYESQNNGCFYFHKKAITHVKENGHVVEKIVTTFQRKKRHGMRVRHPADTWVLTWLRLTTKRSRCV